MKKDYTYFATVVSVYDGDTITADIDLGFGIKHEGQKLRLFGIDAPEVRGEERPEGLKTRDWMRGHLPEGAKVVIKTHKADKKGKYGRWLAEIIAEIPGEGWVCLNQRLVALGLAREAHY